MWDRQGDSSGPAPRFASIAPALEEEGAGPNQPGRWMRVAGWLLGSLEDDDELLRAARQLAGLTSPGRASRRAS